MDTIKVGLVQMAPIWLNREKTIKLAKKIAIW